ncbi:hypothetical protein FRC00_011315 [Tulasnella sp. 408]|nr:hypothetical protein FRC00_011315 [Tulasnella sp. 408]
MPSSAFMNFLLSLPDYAFTMSGDIAVEDRYLFSGAPPGAPANTHGMYPRVVYRFGWMGQGDRVTVSFVLPTPSGPEAVSIAIQVAAWGASIAPAIWKQMILRNLPLGVYDFPVMQ